MAMFKNGKTQTLQVETLQRISRWFVLKLEYGTVLLCQQHKAQNNKPFTKVIQPPVYDNHLSETVFSVILSLIR